MKRYRYKKLKERGKYEGLQYVYISLSYYYYYYYYCNSTQKKGKKMSGDNSNVVSSTHLVFRYISMNSNQRHGKTTTHRIIVCSSPLHYNIITSLALTELIYRYSNLFIYLFISISTSIPYPPSSSFKPPFLFFTHQCDEYCSKPAPQNAPPYHSHLVVPLTQLPPLQPPLRSQAAALRNDQTTLLPT